MKKAQLAIALFALVLFAWVIVHVGFSSIAQQLKAMRIALPIILALSLVRLGLQSFTWSASLKGEGVYVDTPRLAAIRLAAQSMGYLTVLGPVISEPMKIKLLGTSPQATVTATFLDDGVYWFTSALLAIVGLLSLPLVAVRDTGYQIVPALLVIGAMVFVITRRSPILSGVARAAGNSSPKWLARAEQFESSIRDYRANQPALVRRIFWIDVACQVLILSEVAVVLLSLHLPIHFFTILVIEGVTRGLKMVSGWIPARLGSDEGGAVSAFALTGLLPVLGLALALNRRVRDLLWALIGIGWLSWNAHVSKRHRNTVSPMSTIFAKEVL
jgi:hypothetical protein